MSSCVVVLSGGQDSTTALFWAKDNFKEVHAVSFDYGQRHAIELRSAIKVGEMAGVRSHEVIELPHLLKSISPLTSDSALEQYDDYKTMDEIIGQRVEKTFVPMRNTLFLTVAANHALSLGINTLVTGVCQEDNANYPDCTLEFITKLNDAFCASLGQSNFKIVTPLMHLTKAETVHLATKLSGCWEALAYSHTSYDGKYPPTDMNHSNVLRAHGFEQAGLPDPLVVRAWKEGLMDLPDTQNYDKLRQIAHG
jgi:7-cyano-7-deazaguanine synthase